MRSQASRFDCQKAQTPAIRMRNYALRKGDASLTAIVTYADSDVH